MERREELFKPRKTFACCACEERNGWIGSWPLDMVVKFVPLGIFTGGPCWSEIWFFKMMLSSALRYVFEAPESALSLICVLGGITVSTLL